MFRTALDSGHVRVRTSSAVARGPAVTGYLGLLTVGFTGHERETIHWPPARMSAPCATLCYPSVLPIALNAAITFSF